ncbi:SIS domain-containing protein [Sphingomonas ginkgonis]|uniref:SIS domain-containing protein n=2 Tax=Sphingomonas ginkgonis TaxID=2315330 RepID=A0A3R9WMP8_9SPHN|nr:SIS domain-containing protein [Sphingomonas ginkgonis]
MFAEAADAAAAVARQLAANRAIVQVLAERLRAEPPPVVLTCARGSSDHAATYLKHLVETRVEIPVASVSPSVTSIYGAAPAARGMLALALSQSGRSPDLVSSMGRAAEAGALTVAMVNDADSPLAARCEQLLPLHAGPETSVAATKSYIAQLAASLALVAAWSGDTELGRTLAALPDRLAAAWKCDWSSLVDLLEDARGLYVIGRGPGFGIAQEAALKFKETCGLHAEAFSAAELRHGPMALVGADFPVLVVRQPDQSADATNALVEDLVARRVRVLVTGPPIAGALALPLPAACAVTTPILAIQAFYRAANALSVRRGHDPDRPPLLRKVTETV